MKRVLLLPFSQLDATALAQRDGMSKQSTILSPDCTTGQAPMGHWCFQCLVFIVIIPGKNKIQLFAAMSTQEYGHVLRAAGEEFLKSPWQLYTNT